MAWLAKTYPCSESSGTNCVKPDTPVRDYRLSPRFSEFSFLHVATVSLLDMAGWTSLARRVEESGTFSAVERLNLDGLLALWHPSVGN